MHKGTHNLKSHKVIFEDRKGDFFHNQYISNLCHNCDKIMHKAALTNQCSAEPKAKLFSMLLQIKSLAHVKHIKSTHNSIVANIEYIQQS